MNWLKPTWTRLFMEVSGVERNSNKPDHFQNLSRKLTEHIYSDQKTNGLMIDAAHTIAEFLLTYVDDPNDWENVDWSQKLNEEVDLDDLGLALITLISAVKQLDELNSK